MRDYPRFPYADGFCEIADTGRVFIRRYVGRFGQPSLQDKADTGCWYVVGVSGTPAGSVYGEGDSPRAAVQDASNRKRKELRKLNEVCDILASAEDFGFPEDV